MTEPTPAAAPAPAPAAPLTEAEDKQWASFAHLGGIIGALPALIIFLVFKDRGARTNVEAKEALNWQITLIGTGIILGILTGIFTAIGIAISLSDPYGAAAAVGGLVGGIPGFLWFLVAVANLVFSIMGFAKVNGGGAYRYPVAIRLIK